MFQNNETAAMLVFQTNPVGVELFSYIKTFVNLFQKICIDAGHVSKNSLYQIALNLVPSVFSFSNMAAGERIFSPAAAILKNKKTPRTRLDSSFVDVKAISARLLFTHKESDFIAFSVTDGSFFAPLLLCCSLQCNKNFEVKSLILRYSKNILNRQ